MPSPISADCLADLDGIGHGFFTREGGVSEGIYASLNCGVGSKDARAPIHENRARVARHLGTEAARLLTSHQMHSADARVVAEPWALEALPRCDALVTATPGIAVAALAADCAPVLFADAQARVVAVAHAGWKGALGGILQSTIATMERLGARRHRLRAVLGPCIGPSAYEVGPEFEATFTAADPANARFFSRPPGAARAHFDLPAYVLHNLAGEGLDTVEDCTACTYSDERRFFSYRRATHRGEADYGRQISAILLHQK